jgi:hypothetical protein
MIKPITYLQFDSAMRELGFRRVEPANAPIGYKHDASETIVLLREHHPDEVVPAGTLGATRKLVVDRGLVDSKRWDELFQPVSHRRRRV